MLAASRSVPGLIPATWAAWVALLLALLFIYTDVDARIAYIAYEQDWRLLAWLFSSSYPEL